MSALIQREYDKFSGKTTTSTCQVDGMHCSIRFRHVVSPKLDSIVLDCWKMTFSHEWLSEGGITIRLNEKTNIDLPAIVNSRNTSRDFVYYRISRELLKEIADASKVELKITGRNINEIFSPMKDKYQPSIQVLAQSLYDAIYGTSEYGGNVQEVMEKMVEFDSEKQLYKKNQEKIDKWKELSSVVWIGGILITIIIAWFLPRAAIFFGIITAVMGSVSLYMLYFYRSKIREYELKYKGGSGVHV